MLQEIEIEAQSLEEARQLIEGKIPEGFYCFSEKVLSDGSPKLSRCAGETIPKAFENAQQAIPSKAEILKKEEVIYSGETLLEIEEFDDDSVRKLVEQQISEDARVDSIKIQVHGSNGFLGIGRRPHKYAVKIIQSAVVEVSYIELAKVKAFIKRLPSVTELLETLCKLEKEISEQWLRLDEPLPNEMVALMLMEWAFGYLQTSVSEPFNEILTDAKKLFAEDSDIQNLNFLKLGPPDGNYDINDIPLISNQFKEAVISIRRLEELVAQRDNGK